MGSTFAIGIVLLVVVALAAFFKVMLTNEAEQDHQERVTEQVEKDRKRREAYARMPALPDVNYSQSFEYQRSGGKDVLRPIHVGRDDYFYSEDPYNLRTYTRDKPIRWEPGAAKLPNDEVVFTDMGDHWYAHDKYGRWHPNLG
jgi:hypothetical protein